MDTKQAYNNWAETYDIVNNPTRSLDEKVVKTLMTDLDGKDIVEAGCGTGKNSIWFSEKGKSLKAFDYSKEMLSLAQKKVIKNNAEFILHDITQPWTFDDQSCDLVSINLILEHIENIDFVFKEAFRILRSNSKLFICELHPSKQAKGSVARFTDVSTNKEIKLLSYFHSKKDFNNAGKSSGFKSINFKDWYDDINKDIPRLLSILLTK
ncbi:MAG: methyltransferase domain-containing protein [Bacteroidetes bacterium]|nr:methyltransferase domain-containing protein [Bacteroidota bacterium]